MTRSRYAPEGNESFDAVVDGHLATVADQLHAALGVAICRCLVLGGGYGRGEGGVVPTPAGLRPHNDYDLVLIHRGAQRHVAAVCEQIGAALGPEFGVHVDITPVPDARVARLPACLTWYELGAGHQVVIGDAEAMAPLRARQLRDVMPSEWGRLLLNRTSGLHFAADVLAGGDAGGILGHEDRAAFVRRQIEKAWLALGDVELARRGHYHHLVRRRQIAWPSRVPPPAWWDRWQDAADWKCAPVANLADIDAVAEIERLMPLLQCSLHMWPVDAFRPLAWAWRTIRGVTPSRWLPGGRMLAPRDRLRRALCAVSTERHRRYQDLVGDITGYRRLWEAVA